MVTFSILTFMILTSITLTWFRRGWLSSVRHVHCGIAKRRRKP